VATPADPQELAERRRRRLWQLGATVIVAAAVVIIAIAIGRAGGDDPGTVAGPPERVEETNAMFRGIPQRELELGSPRARVTVVEFADLQCPFCGEFAREVLPEVVRRYVRPGRVRLVFRTLDFIGEDSTRAARMAAAAGLQNRLWHFVELVFHNQGGENEGWVTDNYLRRIAAAAGLDVARAFRDRDGAVARGRIEGAKVEAEAAGIDRTPSFTVALPGGSPEKLDGDPGSVEEFTKALDEALAAGG
jgi:protein-disulfide isomerase